MKIFKADYSGGGRVVEIDAVKVTAKYVFLKHPSRKRPVQYAKNKSYFSVYVDTEEEAIEALAIHFAAKRENLKRIIVRCNTDLALATKAAGEWDAKLIKLRKDKNTP